MGKSTRLVLLGLTTSMEQIMPMLVSNYSILSSHFDSFSCWLKNYQILFLISSALSLKNCGIHSSSKVVSVRIKLCSKSQIDQARCSELGRKVILSISGSGWLTIWLDRSKSKSIISTLNPFFKAASRPHISKESKIQPNTRQFPAKLKARLSA